MSSIPIADSDIVGWTPEYLALRRVPHLKTLIQRLKLKFPDVDAEARPEGRRGKKGFDKARTPRTRASAGALSAAAKPPPRRVRRRAGHGQHRELC